MPVTQTIWVLQWYRYIGMAKSQDAPCEFWVGFQKIAVPASGQITEVEIKKLKDLMAKFNLNL